MSATLDQLRRYVGGLTVYLRNFGAAVPEPTLDGYPTGEVGFEFVAVLPGPDQPRSAIVRVGEIWEPIGAVTLADHLTGLSSLAVDCALAP